jgi:tetratricopeptide (TPR) repeat protein
MPEPTAADRTGAYVPTDSLDAALGVAFGPSPGVLANLTLSLPGLRPVHLREPAADDSGAVERPNSREAPPPGGAGRYQVFGEIARGGMGAVLRGRDPDLGRDVAIKVLREEHRDNPRMVERFVEEAQIGGQLQHPGIVPVYELGQFTDRRPFFTMKLVKGRTLAAQFADRTDPADGRARLLAVFAQVCHTVAYAHARGIIHRDLKPSNIMVGHFGEVQVMDWGLAKVLAQGGIADEIKTNGSRAAPQNFTEVKTVRTGSSPAETMAGSLLGTPAYMAPEQARGETTLVDERADVFGLGALLCELLTGRPPYTGESQAEVQRKASVGALEDAVARLDACGADAELLGLAKRCLAPEPWNRPRDAKAVADGVSAYLAATEDRLHKAERERAVAEARTAEERKRRRVSLALAAVVVMLLGFGGTVAWWWNDRQTAAVRATEAALAQADEFRDKGQWTDARSAVERAEAVMPGRASAGLGGRIAAARAELTLLLALDEVRLRYSDMRAAPREDAARPADEVSLFDGAGADAGYTAAFRAIGLDADTADPAAAAALVPAAVREPIASALDHWGVIKAAELSDRDGWKKRLKLARAVDVPDQWRQQFRDARLANDAAAIAALAARPDRASQPPAILVHLARDLRDIRSNPQLAATILRDTQRRHPDDFWVNFELGQTCMRLKEANEAARYFGAAMAARPNNALVIMNLAWSLVILGQYDEVTILCRRAIQLRPDYDWPHGMLGYIHSVHGRTEDALAEANEAIRCLPQAASWHSNRGSFLEALNRPAEAEAALCRALEFTPDHQRALNILHELLGKRGRPGDMEPFLRRALEKSPEDANALDKILALLKDQKRPADRVAVVRACLAKRPESVGLQVRLAYASALPADFDAAIVASQKQMGPKPTDSQHCVTLSRMLVRRNRFAEAETSARDAIRLAPDNADGYLRLDAILMMLGRRAEAVEMLRTALVRVPDDARLHNQLGYHLSDLGRTRESLGPLQRAVTLNYNMSLSWNSLGFSRFRLGDFIEARDAMIQARDADGRAKTVNPELVASHDRRAKDMDRLAELATRMPAMIDGTMKPADPREGIKFGQVCQYRGFPAAALGFYRAAFTEDPKLAQSFDLFQAVCGAVELSTRGADRAEATAARRQAYDWLRTDFVRVDKQLKGTVRQVNDARLWLNRWRENEELNPIRSPADLAKLPAAERSEWEQFWADVNSRSAKLKNPEPPEVEIPEPAKK